MLLTVNDLAAGLGWVSSIATFAFVMSVTPGPNNLLLMNCGAQLGYRRTLPSLAGVAAGFAIVISACNAGSEMWMPSHGFVEVMLNAAASAYMLYLAARLWTTSGREPTVSSKFFSGMLSFTLFQLINPKAWVASLAFTAGFLGYQNPWGGRADLMATALFVAITFGSCSLYVVLGASTRSAALRSRSTFERALAVLAVGTAATFWI